MDQISAYTVMGIICVTSILLMALIADGWDGWR